MKKLLLISSLLLFSVGCDGEDATILLIGIPIYAYVISQAPKLFFMVMAMTLFFSFFIWLMIG